VLLSLDEAFLDHKPILLVTCESCYERCAAFGHLGGEIIVETTIQDREEEEEISLKKRRFIFGVVTTSPRECVPHLRDWSEQTAASHVKI
jgi:hypothetical protein